MNDLMSGGVHRVWKDIAADRLNPQPGETILDCAGGTGDIALRLAKLADAARARRGGEAAQVVVVDYNAEMLGVGRGRLGAARDRLDASATRWRCHCRTRPPTPM